MSIVNNVGYDPYRSYGLLQGQLTKRFHKLKQKNHGKQHLFIDVHTAEEVTNPQNGGSFPIGNVIQQEYAGVDDHATTLHATTNSEAYCGRWDHTDTQGPPFFNTTALRNLGRLEDFVVGSNERDGKLIGSFDYRMDGLPLCKELYTVCTKLKKSHPHIKIRLPVTKWYEEDTLITMDTFTLWALNQSHVGNKVTIARWEEEQAPHLECNRRGFMNGFHLTAVALYDPKADAYLGVIQYVPAEKYYTYYSPRIHRENSDYAGRHLRIYGDNYGDMTFTTSKNGVRLLTTIKKTLKPISIREMFWDWQSVHELTPSVLKNVTETAREKTELVGKFAQKLDKHKLFERILEVYNEGEVISMDTLTSAEKEVVEGYNERVAEIETHIEVHEDLQPVTFVQPHNSNSIYFTTWDGRRDGADAVGGLVKIKSDLIPIDIQKNIAALNMVQKTNLDNGATGRGYYRSDTEVVSGVGGYSNRVLQDSDAFVSEKGMWFKDMICILASPKDIDTLVANAEDI